MIWKLYNFRCLRSESHDKLTIAAAENKLPSDVVLFLQAEIDRLPEACRAVKIDAHGGAHDHSNKSGDVTRNADITVVGIVA